MGRGVAFRRDLAAMAAGSDAPPRQSVRDLASPGQEGAPFQPQPPYPCRRSACHRPLYVLPSG